MTKRSWNLISGTVLVTSFISFIIGLLNIPNIKTGYEAVAFMPIIYMFIFLLSINFITKTDYKITATVFFAFQWIRFCLMPAIIAIAGENCENNGISVSVSHLRLATVLISLEFIVSSIFLWFMARKKIKIREKTRLHLSGSTFAYFLFGILAVFIFLYNLRRGVRLVNFLVIPAGSEERLGDIVDTSTVIARQIFLLATMIAFLVVTNYCVKRYNLTQKQKYFYISIIVALLNVCIIIGERRSAQIYTAFCCCYVLILAYPYKKKKILFWVCGTAGIVIIFMSIYKVFNAFAYASYEEAMNNAEFTIGGFSQTLQSYFLGPQNVALAIRFAKSSHLNLFNLIFDFCRSTVPISFLFKNSGVTTSVMFNNYLYHGAQDSGHLLSSVGYGYIYGGILFCWCTMVLNIACALFCEKMLKTRKNYEEIYLWAYVMMRFVFSLIINTPALISASSIMLFTAYIVILAARFLRINR